MKICSKSGQAIIELALTLPLLLAMLSVGFDLGNKAFVVHRLNQAAYEGVKLVSQVDDPIIDDCTNVPKGSEATTACLRCDVANNKTYNCLSQAMVTRARRALQEAGINPTDKALAPTITFVEDTQNESDGTYRYLSIKIDHNFKFILIGMTTPTAIKVGTVYKKI